MIDIHHRRARCAEAGDAWRWLGGDTPVEEAAHSAKPIIADRRIYLVAGKPVSQCADPSKNSKELLTLISEEQ